MTGRIVNVDRWRDFTDDELVLIDRGLNGVRWTNDELRIALGLMRELMERLSSIPRINAQLQRDLGDLDDPLTGGKP